MLEVLGGRGPDVRSRRSSARRSLAGEPLLFPDLPRICAARSLLDFALHPASFGPCHAAFFTLFLKPVLFYDLAFPCSREGMEGVVGLQPSSAELLGLFFLSSAVGSCSDARMGWGKPIWGREARRSLLPLLFWCLCCCHLRSHSCSENIVADT